MKIKICGLSREQDIEYANRYKPDYIGFIINFPKSHRSISVSRAIALHSVLSSEIPAVGVTVNQDFAFNASLLENSAADIVQLHGNEPDSMIIDLKAKTGKPVWKAFKIRSYADLEEAQSSSADLILLDNGCGTGQTFDWSVIRDIDRPFALAGGLNVDNLAQAAKLHPYLADLSGGAETDKVKDPDKIKKLIDIARRIP